MHLYHPFELRAKTLRRKIGRTHMDSDSICMFVDVPHVHTVLYEDKRGMKSTALVEKRHSKVYLKLILRFRRLT